MSARESRAERPVLILGAGINGAALARELALHGLSVAVVDSADLSSGATAYSSRLIHGGLRYLEYREFALVRESLAERARLLRLAPQFVRPLRLFIPISRRWGGWWPALCRFLGLRSRGRAPRGLWLVRLGLWLYDRLAQDAGLPPHSLHRIGAEHAPEVDAGRFRWMCEYHDAQIVYPERFVVALLRDAERLAQAHSAELRVFTYHRAERCAEGVRIVPVPETVGRGAASCPAEHLLSPSVIVNATGAWVDETLARLRVESPRLMGGTKGSHIVTWHEGLRRALRGGGVYAEAEDGRPIFILPLGEATLVGTTDLPHDEPPEAALATQAELEYLLAGVRRVFPQLQLTRSDVDFHYSGVRPLPYASQQTPASITRRHHVVLRPELSPPLVSLVGGKLTTCRSLAEEAASDVLKLLGRTAAASSREHILPGGENYPTSAEELAAAVQDLAAQTLCSPRQVRAAWQLCGQEAGRMLLQADGAVLAPEDRESLAGSDLPVGFVRRVIREEWVTRLADLVERRLMLLYDRRLNAHALAELARLLVLEGRLAEREVPGEIEAATMRLQSKFGRRLDAAP